MTEMHLDQKELSKLLGIGTSRVDAILNGKGELPLNEAREIGRKLKIDAGLTE